MQNLEYTVSDIRGCMAFQNPRRLSRGVQFSACLTRSTDWCTCPSVFDAEVDDALDGDAGADHVEDLAAANCGVPGGEPIVREHSPSIDGDGGDDEG